MSHICLGDPNVGRVLDVLEFRALAWMPQTQQQDDDLIPEMFPSITDMNSSSVEYEIHSFTVFVIVLLTDLFVCMPFKSN